MTRRNSHLHAFTMIEVMIVVVLLAITAAIAMPMVGNRADLKLSAATRAMMGDVQYAQNYAVATRQSVYVRFSANAYTLCTRNGTTLVPIKHPVDRGDFTVSFSGASSAKALAGVSLTQPSWGGDSILGFDSLGTPFTYVDATAVKTTLSSRKNVLLTSGSVSRRVFVEPYTGEITVQ